MKIFTSLCGSDKKRKRYRRTASLSLLIFLASISCFRVYGQTTSWSESFVANTPTTPQQCDKWNTFLDQLAGKNFASVTLSGTFDEVGKSINDPAAATKLASLLSTRTPGSVQVGGEYWTISSCGTTVCNHNGFPSIELSVNTTGSGCSCSANYAIRPSINTVNWGGVNTSTCPGPAQTIRLEFNSGVSIVASGPTAICPDGGSVTLTATTKICSGPYTYLWSNGFTSESITVTEPGRYSVSVTSTNGCSGTSAETAVTVSDVSVDAGDDVTICTDPIQLMARGTSGAGATEQVNTYCVFDSPGGAGNCSFTDNLCSAGDGSQKVINSSFSQSITLSTPDELRVLLYYSPYSPTTFNFKLNGQQIGTFFETIATGDCESGKHNQYPHTITFTRDQLAAWKENGANDVTVEVLADEPGVYVAGVVIETVSSNASYSWSPLADLSDASIPNPIANPAETTTYTVTYTDSHGCSATDQVVVKVDCSTAPVAICKPVTVEADANCEALVSAADFDGGSSSRSGSPLTFSISPEGPYAVGETAITLTVTDASGESSTCTTTLTVIDSTLPTIIAPADVTTSNDPGTCSARVALSKPGASDNCGISSITNDHEGYLFPVGETTVTWTATDAHGNQTTALQKVTVTNNAPSITSVTASPGTAGTNEEVSLSVTYEDNNAKTAIVDWGDLSGSETIADPEASFNISHRYQHEGMYAATVTVTDQCDASATYVFESIIVVSRHSGSVKGSGWYYSEPDFYVKNKRAAGKAQFQFSAAYSQEGQELKGKIAFAFRQGPLDFKSTGLEMLEIDGQNAILTGEGKLNKKTGYRILIGMYDGGNQEADGAIAFRKKEKDHHGDDRIRVKIWDPFGAVVYDTQTGSEDDAYAVTALGGGSIEIHQTTFGDFMDDSVASYFDEGSTEVYPNPFADWLSVRFVSESGENVNLQLMDLTGRVIFDRTYRVSDDGSYSIDLPNDVHKGLYILTIKQGKRVEYLRLLRE